MNDDDSENLSGAPLANANSEYKRELRRVFAAYVAVVACLLWLARGSKDTLEVESRIPSDTADIARRISEMNVEVFAAQKVEHIEILREFDRDHLGGLEATSKTWHQPGVEDSDQTGLLTVFQTTLTCAIGLLAPLD